MLALLLSAALASTMVAPTQATTCDTSERYRQLDESVLDLAPAPGTAAVPLTIGCRFIGVPGAIIDVGGDAVPGLEVVGIRRGQGMVLVQATPAQTRLLRRQTAPVAATQVRDGDWGPLIEAMERLPR